MSNPSNPRSSIDSVDSMSVNNASGRASVASGMMSVVSSMTDDSGLQNRKINPTISDPDINTLVDNFGSNFIAIIQKLEGMIRNAKNKDSNLTIDNLRDRANVYGLNSIDQDGSDDQGRLSGDNYSFNDGPSTGLGQGSTVIPSASVPSTDPSNNLPSAPVPSNNLPSAPDPSTDPSNNLPSADQNHSSNNLPSANLSPSYDNLHDNPALNGTGEIINNPVSLNPIPPNNIQSLITENKKIKGDFSPTEQNKIDGLLDICDRIVIEINKKRGGYVDQLFPVIASNILNNINNYNYRELLKWS